MMIVNIYNYAGKGFTKTIELNQTPEKYLLGIQSVGYDGPVSALLERLYEGQLIHIDQFLISFSYQPD